MKMSLAIDKIVVMKIDETATRKDLSKLVEFLSTGFQVKEKILLGKSTLLILEKIKLNPSIRTP